MPAESHRQALEQLAAMAGGDEQRARELADWITTLVATDDPDDVFAVRDALLRVFSGRADPIDFVVEGEEDETGAEVLARYRDFTVVWHSITRRFARRLEELG